MHSKLKIKFHWCILSALVCLTFVNCHSNSDKVDLKNVNSTCVSNMACIQRLANQVFEGLSEHKVVDFGVVAIEPVEGQKSATTGRSAKLVDFMGANKLKIPIGSYYLSVQKSDEYKNYFEFAVGKNVEGKFLNFVQLKVE